MCDIPNELPVERKQAALNYCKPLQTRNDHEGQENAQVPNTH